MLSLQIEIFLLMLAGYIMAKKNYLSKQTRTQLTNIVLMVILPCAIIKSFQVDIEVQLLKSCFFILLISFSIQLLYGLFNHIFLKRWMKINVYVANME